MIFINNMAINDKHIRFMRPFEPECSCPELVRGTEITYDDGTSTAIMVPFDKIRQYYDGSLIEED